MVQTVLNAVSSGNSRSDEWAGADNRRGGWLNRKKADYSGF